MLNFSCDYNEGCHEAILQALIRTNLQQEPGYGADSFTKSAKEKIRTACESPDADIYFINGGTQTNQLVIDTMLAPYEGVISAHTGHVNAHEAGAIEFSGHKVLALPGYDGKLRAEDVSQYLRAFYADPNYDHMVFPGMVYISHPTEYGTVYTAKELIELSELCREYKIPLYLDGARLGYGLAAPNTDVTLPLIAALCDAFYIGGTKVGALNGEALVFPRHGAPSHFLTRIKQHGALSAKGRLIGIQFDTLFTDGLYERISAHAIAMAQKLIQVFQSLGIPFFMESPTNQQFFILENSLLEKLTAQQVGCSIWEPYDETHTVVRFATSWATKAEAIDALETVLRSRL